MLLLLITKMQLQSSLYEPVLGFFQTDIKIWFLSILTQHRQIKPCGVQGQKRQRICGSEWQQLYVDLEIFVFECETQHRLKRQTLVISEM